MDCALRWCVCDKHMYSRLEPDRQLELLALDTQIDRQWLARVIQVSLENLLSFLHDVGEQG